MIDQVVRDSVIATIRARLPAMVRLGMTPTQIVASLDGTINDTEADLVWLLARYEAAAAGRAPIMSSHLMLAG